jgi:aconitate hydratase
VPEALQGGGEFTLENQTKGTELTVRHGLSGRQIEVLLKGGLINWMRERLEEREG